MSYKHSIKINNVYNSITFVDNIIYNIFNNITNSLIDSGQLGGVEKIVPVPPGEYRVQLIDIGAVDCAIESETLTVPDSCGTLEVSNVEVVDTIDPNIDER